MYYYFSSNDRCAIKLNGIYNGLISSTNKGINILDDKTLVELIPLNNESEPLSFILDAQFLANPPCSAKVIDLQGGYFIVFNCVKTLNEIKVICQQKFNNLVATLYCDKGYKLCIETPNDFYTTNILEDVIACEIKLLNNGCEALAIDLTNQTNEHTLKIFDVSDKILELFSCQCNQVKISDNITTINYYKDVAKHTVTKTYSVDKNKVNVVSFDVQKKDVNLVNSLSPSLIPYAFLEDFMLDDNIDCYLSQDVKQNAHKLRDYLGEFIGVMPPPQFREYDEIGLIRKISQNLYKVDYVKISIVDKLITNIKLI